MGSCAHHVASPPGEDSGRRSRLSLRRRRVTFSCSTSASQCFVLVLTDASVEDVGVMVGEDVVGV